MGDLCNCSIVCAVIEEIVETPGLLHFPCEAGCCARPVSSSNARGFTAGPGPFAFSLNVRPIVLLARGWDDFSLQAAFSTMGGPILHLPVLKAVS